MQFYLAKAIAIRARDLKRVRDTWLNTADLERLLNTGDPLNAKRSLLRGDWMYQQLYEAFGAMKPDGDVPETTTDRIDLFVTTTDLNGVCVPIRLDDMSILEKVHRGSFNFRYDGAILSGGPTDDQLAGRDDFGTDFDAMLAFAARCTSSFPIAFAPMKLCDIKATIGSKKYDLLKPKYEPFFRWIPDAAFYRSCGPALEIEDRELADGGYLDNKPFDLAIGALTFRASPLPHSRKLLFLDPFPEAARDEATQPHFNFVQNAMAAATTLPRYQTIRQGIERVQGSNFTQQRLGSVLADYRSGNSQNFKAEENLDQDTANQLFLIRR